MTTLRKEIEGQIEDLLVYVEMLEEQIGNAEKPGDDLQDAVYRIENTIMGFTERAATLRRRRKDAYCTLDILRRDYAAALAVDEDHEKCVTDCVEDAQRNETNDKE